MPKWMRRFAQNHPPLADPRSCYDLAGQARGGAVFVVAPGPSLDSFPREALYDQVTIGVNSTAELFSPTFWLFQEGIFCKKYHGIYTSGWLKRIVTTWARVSVILPLLPKGKEVYGYSFRTKSVLRMRKDRAPEGKPYWYDETDTFLPGHNTVAANAMSLAVLMEPALIVLVGVDLYWDDSIPYYAHGVKRNSGPKDRFRALSASRAWMNKAATRGVWSGTRIVTTSPWLKLRGVRRVSPGTALKEAGECRKVTIE